jgi:hypothetical protein
VHDDGRSGAVQFVRRGGAETLGAPCDEHTATGEDVFGWHVVHCLTRAPAQVLLTKIPDTIHGVAAEGFVA